MTPAAYRELLGIARRCSRRASEADDLFQDALLEAVKAGRSDLMDAGNRNWLAGVIRNRARFAARSAARRIRREAGWFEARPAAEERGEPTPVAEILDTLPPSLKAVAALALTGHNRREISYLLKLSDTALRQRVSGLRRAIGRTGTTAAPLNMPGLNLNLAYGSIRDALLPLLLRRGGVFASHDPDGHLFVIRRG